MDDLPYIVKILFCLPVIDILWAIYRIVKGVCKGHIVTLIAGIIWFIAARKRGYHDNPQDAITSRPFFLPDRGKKGT